jgi:hypothetical protein
MQGDPLLGGSGGVAQRAKGFMAKATGVALGAVMLAGAFAVSLAFFVFILAAGLVVGGYLWWKTRDLRRQLREQMRQHDTGHAQRDVRSDEATGNVIEGVVISRSETRD